MSAPLVECARCGTDVVADAVFCTYCHFRLPEYMPLVAVGGGIASDAATDEVQRGGAGHDAAEDGGGASDLRRSRRTSLVTALVTALVAGAVASAVAVTVAIVIDGDDPPDRGPEPVVVMREQPTRRWRAEVAGEVVAHEHLDDALFVLAAHDNGFELTAFAAPTGDVLWSTRFGPNGDGVQSSADAPFGDVTLLDAGLAVVYGPSFLDRRGFAMVDPTSGAVAWTAALGLNAFEVTPAGLIIGSADDEGNQLLQVIDEGNRVVGAVFSADFYIGDDDDAYVLVDDTLSHVLPVAAQASIDIGGTDVIDAQPVGDLLLLIELDRVTAVSLGRSELWSMEVPIGGLLGPSHPFGDDEIVIEGAAGTRVVRAADGRLLATAPFDYDRLDVVAGPGDRGVVMGHLRVAAGESRVDVYVTGADGSFDHTGVIDGFVEPQVQSAGSIAYVVETQVGPDAHPRIAAVALPRGDQLWELTLDADVRPVLTRTGLLEVSYAEDTIAFYST